jgi:superfamily II DNA or RNA helicase
MIVLDYIPTTRKIQITPDDMDVFNELREHFSVKNEDAKFAKAKASYSKQKYVQDRKYIITPTGMCPPGLYGEIENYLHTQQITGVRHTDRYIKYVSSGIDANVYDDLNLKLRYYQKEVIKRGLSTGCGICIVGTGGGKTLICASLIQSYYEACEYKDSFKCLLIVPNIGLVAQTYKDFLEYGVTFNMTTWTGKQTPDMSANVIICNSAILVRRYDSNNWIQNVDLVLVDEVHALSNANKVSKVISKIKTINKYGFTGTLPIEPYTRWNVIGAIGPVLYEKTSDDLRKEDYLVNVFVNRLEIKYKTPIANKTNNAYYNELEFIYMNEYRNNLLKTICNSYNKNILILVNHIKHGEQLLSVLKQLQRPVYFIQGSIEVSERADVIKQMEMEEGVICIAISKIFSEGINIKNLHMLIFASGGKAFTRTVQAIGRGLRKHPSKSVFNIIDVCDVLYYCGEHGAKRMAIYDREKIKYKTKQLQENG